MNRLLSIFLLLLGSLMPTTRGEASALVMSGNMEVVKGLILVEAHINGQTGRFILDTGAPDLVLNSRYFSGQKSDVVAVGIHGEVEELAEVAVTRFNWLNIQKEFIQAIALNMLSLEKSTQRPILGLIGYRILQDHELLIDYKNRRIELIPTGEVQGKNSRLLARLPFYLRDHLPIIQVKVGDFQLNLGLDSGAQSNLLDVELLGVLPEELLRREKELRITGLEQRVATFPVRELSRVTLGTANIRGLSFAFLPLPDLMDRQTLSIDGLLGFPFLSQAKVSINYAKGELSFYE